MAKRGKEGKAKSKAQEELAGNLREWFPFSRVRQEVYIGELIEARGYTMEEMAAELGNRPHRMFCDVLLSDSEGDWAFEYHGEQHYHVIEGMTSTERVLAMNQHLDREKSWILERIGIPLVAVPYDAYVDAEVASRLMEEASAEVEKAMEELDECESCGRRFPSQMLVGGMCKRCRKEEETRVKAEYEEQRRRGRAIAERDLPVDEEPVDGYGGIGDDGDPADDATAVERIRREEEWKARKKEEAKARRKAAYQEWKASPEAQRQKEEQRAARRAAYQQRKEWLKEQRRKAKEQGDE